MASKESIVYLETLLENYNQTPIQTVEDEIGFLLSKDFLKLEELNLLFLQSMKIYYIKNPTRFERNYLGFSARVIIGLKFGALIKNPFVFNFDKGLTFKKTLNNNEEDINNYDLLKLLLEKIKERLF